MNKQTICIFLNSQTANSYINGYTSECMFVLPSLVIPKRFIIVMILIIN
jgi:hypothetical protein